MPRKILFLSGREVSYIRNHMMIKALRSAFDVDVLTPEVSTTIGRTALGIARSAGVRGYDLYFAGFYGQPIAVALAAMRRGPIMLDAYVSTFETLCEDRRTISPSSILGRAAAWLDKASLRVAKRVVTDTASNAQYYHDAFDVSDRKLSTLYIGCDESIFHPVKCKQVEHEYEIEVFYYGAFLPLQGMDVIVRAAALLRDRPEIRFRIGGDGMCRPQLVQLIEKLSLHNIDLLGWIPFGEVPAHIACATICLGGHFSTIPKAARVISTKTFQFIAMRKPTIVGVNAATAELFDFGHHVVGVPMNDPRALADAILTLGEDCGLRESVASAGYELFRDKLTTSAIARQLVALVEATLCTSRS